MKTISDSDIAEAILEMRDLLRLIAAPEIATRDRQRRLELRRIVGVSKVKAQAVHAMDGNRDQTSIHKKTGIQKSNLSTLVKQLGTAGLLSDDSKHPRLKFGLPIDFFDEDREEPIGGHEKD